ncbi:hypothetical protein MGYG_04540 [Nannizzia gypsea CBS 118893]|uniref:mRNA export factor GLE1 n=1 Tax=Arthroderma gypseum (strain ATCC MYA-4604 / CBS 118893) TaxID=535722 RepID=E4UTJ2_ARTGP|nr:hypothetical protein MGYG_04540 [Nannizzia gypsea CBS 118893]EFR01537.1 hypothetical protein MGYG_04540 [Nannizzia gypsea CBS 118893]
MVRVNTLAYRAPDSPSRQLLQELTRDLEQVRIHGEELKLVKAYESRTFHEKLDRIDREREEIHTNALNAAAAKRDQRRLQAEETLRLHLQAVEEERRRKEEAERRRQEKIRQEKEEKAQKEREEAARLEAERKAKEAEKARQAEEAEKARRAAEEEKARLQRERAEQERKKADDESRRRAEEEAKRKAAEEKQQQQQQAATKQGISGASYRTQQEIQEHDRYLKLHAHLKEFRTYMRAQTKTNALLKQHMGDMRRTIRKCVGQLVADDKAANQKPTREIATILKKAQELAEPSVDIRQFIAFPPPNIANAENPQVPALWLMFEAGVTTKCAEPLGVLTAQIFSMDAFCYQGQSMIDILMAKYRFLCPVLWGFYGDQSTDQGKAAIGWYREEKNGPFISPQLHEERMTGLGAGYAAIALRNFAKSPRQNPYPNSNFWKSLSYIVNVPPAEVQDTHLVVLTAMLRYSAPRIVNFWGDMGVLALRQAIVLFPAKLPRKSTQRAMVEDLRDVLAREKRIII